MKNLAVSIIIPIANDADFHLFDKTLNSIFSQSYQKYEVIVVIEKGANPNLFKTLRKFPKVKVLTKNLGKSEAQNWAVKKAKGDYLLIHDVDRLLVSSTLKKTLQFAEAKNCSLSLHKRFKGNGNYWIQCRNFDLELLLKSGSPTPPNFIKRSLFLKVGGYNPKFDPLDDWYLQNKFQKMNIPIYIPEKPFFITNEKTDPFHVIRQKYKRGQAYALIKKSHPADTQGNIIQTAKIYSNWPLLLSRPQLLPGLIAIKLLNAIPFYAGMINPKKSKVNLYEQRKIAKSFEKKGLATNLGRYKHFTETLALNKLLAKVPSKVLEVGAGTGRITEFLINKGFKLTATEPSEAMLTLYKRKTTLPKPIKAAGENLPFKDNSFPLIVSIRVLWHITNKTKQKRFTKELCRVSNKEIILDITNKSRYGNLFFRIPAILVAIVFNINFGFEHTFLFELKEFEKIVGNCGFEISEKIPLDVSTPFWINLLPSKVADKLFPFLYKSDFYLSRIIPPGRYMLKIKRIS
jgi:ubiquinone/menaquinone biosynthesis C-methylase UbiE